MSCCCCCCCSLPSLCVSVCFDRVYIQTTHSVEQQCSHSVAAVPLTEPINGVMLLVLLVVAWDLAGEKRECRVRLAQTAASRCQIAPDMRTMFAVPACLRVSDREKVCRVALTFSLSFSPLVPPPITADSLQVQMDIFYLFQLILLLLLVPLYDCH